MAATCWSSVRGRALRATKVDQCGAVVEGAGGTLTTDGFITVNYSLELDEGTEILRKNAAGVICINEPPRPSVKWVNLEIQFCKVDPDLINMFTGWPVVLNAAGAGVGFRIRDEIQVSAGAGIEVWSDISGQACVGGDPLFGYFLAPWVNQGILGDFSISEEDATFTLTGKGRVGSQWGTGPYNVDLDALGDPTNLLTPIGPRDAMDIHATAVPPPNAACGATALVAA